jgi:MoaA/NifB/PqqE/SkfB family radical SAM enzyme
MDQNDMAFEVFEKVYRSFPGLERLELHGEGEPMLSPHFFDMARAGSEQGVFVSAITNGSMFSTTRIDKLLDSGIQTLFVSIESPRTGEFRQIRGGSLTRVKRGIQTLLHARDDRGQTTPSVGFSVTVLKTTRNQLREIADLYLELNMDGGISAHMLNTMPDYLRQYTPGMESQVLTPTEQALAWLRYSRMMCDPALSRARIHFSDIVFGQVNREKESENPPPHVSPSAREYRSCPWLDHALYVNRHGDASGCARIKKTNEYGFGNVVKDSVDTILQRRRALSDQVVAGQVPAACSGCFIAESISLRLNHLLDKKPRRLTQDVTEEFWSGGKNRAAGSIEYAPESVDIMLESSNGVRTGREIIDHIADRWRIGSDESRRRVLPVLAELIRLNAVSCVEDRIDGQR